MFCKFPYRLQGVAQRDALLALGRVGKGLGAEKTRSQPVLVIALGEMLAVGAAPYPSV
jgi:hypothetical protein